MSWQIDNTHSQIQFTVRHMMITNMHGWFDKFSGTVDFNEADPIRSQIDIQIETTSINTKDAKRDEHLRSLDFFNTPQYPYLRFKSRRIEKVDDTHGRVIGDLIIHDVYHEVVLDVEYTGQARSPWGTMSAGFNARTKVSRKSLGLNWNQALETGGVLVGDEVTIDIELEIIKQAEPVQVAALAA